MAASLSTTIKADAPGARLARDAVRHWQRHCPSFKALALRDGTVVYRQGANCTQLYYVASGYIKLAATDLDGHGLIRAILRGGDFFGAVHGQPQGMADAAVSKGPVRLYRCDAAEFATMLGTHAGIAQCLLANLGSQLAFARRQTETVLYRSATARVGLMLHELAGRNGGRCRHGHEVDVRLTQQELAELVGASRPVVSTILNDLRARRIVGYTRSFICIESMTSLEQLLREST